MLGRVVTIPALQRKKCVGRVCGVEVYLYRIGPWPVKSALREVITVWIDH